MYISFIHLNYNMSKLKDNSGS